MTATARKIMTTKTDSDVDGNEQSTSSPTWYIKDNLLYYDMIGKVKHEEIKQSIYENGKTIYSKNKKWLSVIEVVSNVNCLPQPQLKLWSIQESLELYFSDNNTRNTSSSCIENEAMRFKIYVQTQTVKLMPLNKEGKKSSGISE